MRPRAENGAGEKTNGSQARSIKKKAVNRGPKPPALTAFVKTAAHLLGNSGKT